MSDWKKLHRRLEEIAEEVQGKRCPVCGQRALPYELLLGRLEQRQRTGTRSDAPSDQWVECHLTYSAATPKFTRRHILAFHPGVVTMSRLAQHAAVMARRGPQQPQQQQPQQQQMTPNVARGASNLLYLRNRAR